MELVLAVTHEGHIQLDRDLLILLRALGHIPALDTRLVEIVVQHVFAVLIHLELVECAIDHPEGHLERILDPMVLLLVLGERKWLPVELFVLGHLVSSFLIYPSFL